MSTEPTAKPTTEPTAKPTTEPAAEPTTASTTEASGGTEQLRADIDRTREDLGDTVQALAAKADVKARARDKAEQVKHRVGEQTGQAAQSVKIKAGSAGEQVRGVVAELPSRARQVTSAPETGPAARKAGAGAAAVSLVGALWLMRRRARRNAGPWHRAARVAQAQLKTVKSQAAVQAKAAGKTAKQQAKVQVTAARAKAKDARATARSKARSRH